MYGIDGRHKLDESALDHLEGYMGSSPVRIGNDAYDQLQLDIYGELLDSLYLTDKHVQPISFSGWKHILKHVQWISENWQRKDDGIWEVRGGQQQFVYSKVMAWVALDRAIRLSRKRSFPADLQDLSRIRDEIFMEIIEKGWNEKRQAFDQYYGSNTLDASTLMMPLVFFMSPYDPMMEKTIETRAILKDKMSPEKSHPIQPLRQQDLDELEEHISTQPSSQEPENEKKQEEKEEVVTSEHLEALAREIYGSICQRLQIERERYGLNPASRRLPW